MNTTRLWADVAGPSRPGTPGTPRVVLLHGFTQTRRSWHHLTAILAQQHCVTAFDLPGHGLSSDVAANLPETAAAVAAAADPTGPAVFIGYSMGARVALHLALLRPDAVQGLILVGGTGGLATEAERADRRADDETLARRLELDGVDPFLDAWLRGPLFRDLVPDPVDLAGRRANTAAGLAMSLRRCGTGTQKPLWERLRGLPIRTLVVAGANDAKFAEIGERLVATIGPTATLSLVPGAGHAAHLEQPDSFNRLVETFLMADVSK